MFLTYIPDKTLAQCVLYCHPEIQLGYEKPPTVQLILFDPSSNKHHQIGVSPELYLMQANGLSDLLSTYITELYFQTIFL